MNLFYAAYLPEFLKHLLFPICFLSTILLAKCFHFILENIYHYGILTFHSSNCCYSIGRKGTCIELCTYSLQRELYSFNIIPIAVLFVLAARNHFFVLFLGQ